MTKSDVQAYRVAERWRREEPACRGYEFRFGVNHDNRLWAFSFWSRRDDAVTRWGIITGYGATAMDAYNDAIQKRVSRLVGLEPTI